jgi:hypothetical protein
MFSFLIPTLLFGTMSWAQQINPPVSSDEVHREVYFTQSSEQSLNGASGILRATSADTLPRGLISVSASADSAFGSSSRTIDDVDESMAYGVTDLAEVFWRWQVRFINSDMDGGSVGLISSDSEDEGSTIEPGDILFGMKLKLRTRRHLMLAGVIEYTNPLATNEVIANDRPGAAGGIVSSTHFGSMILVLGAKAVFSPKVSSSAWRPGAVWDTAVQFAARRRVSVAFDAIGSYVPSADSQVEYSAGMGPTIRISDSFYLRPTLIWHPTIYGPVGAVGKVGDALGLRITFGIHPGVLCP